MSRIATLATLSAVLTLTTACGRSDTAAKDTPAAKPAVSAGLSDSYFLTAAPADARDVKAAKATLKQGDKVVLVGRIGGSEEPFVSQRAIFTLVDKGLKACDEGSEMDSCKTPWDYCCTSREEITANSAVVQIVGTDAQPLKVELNGTHGLRPKATVTVVGTVVKSEGGNVVINATSLFVKP